MPRSIDPYMYFRQGEEVAAPPPKVDYLLGVDLAQTTDYTAIAAIERIAKADGATFHVRDLERFRDRSYVDIARHIRGLVAALRTQGNREITVVVDATGVGRAALDIMRESEIDAPLIAITITGGDVVSGDMREGFRVPKRDLVAVVAVTLQSKPQRLRIRQDMKLAPVLTEELARFKAKINVTTGHDSYESWREADHDDCVLAVALATWFGSRTKPATWSDIDPSALHAFVMGI